MRPSRLEVQTVGCPRCLAEPGQPCRGRRGNRQSNHRERVDGYLMSTQPPPPETNADERAAELRAMPYGDYLRTPEWRERRQNAIDLAGGRCRLCNTDERLHVHHRTYERRGCEHPDDLTVLCEDCHALFHEHRELVSRREWNVSYGAFVHASIQQRRRDVMGGPDWQHAAERFANDNFPDYRESAVIELLRAMRWPDRPVSVPEVQRALRNTGAQPEAA